VFPDAGSYLPQGPDDSPRVPDAVPSSANMQAPITKFAANLLAESPSAKRSVSLTAWPIMSNRTVALDTPDRRLRAVILHVVGPQRGDQLERANAEYACPGELADAVVLEA
jgi:hypothetical protein